MKKLTVTLLFLLLTVSGFAQLSANVSNLHTIPVEDTLTKNVVEEYVKYMEDNPISYEKSMMEIKKIKSKPAAREFIGEFENGVIILNSRLDDFPSTKSIVILHYLAKNNGMKTKKQDNPHVSSEGFHMLKRNEELFTKQLRAESPYKYIVTKLKEESPLKSSL